METLGMSYYIYMYVFMNINQSEQSSCIEKLYGLMYYYPLAIKNISHSHDEMGSSFSS